MTSRVSLITLGTIILWKWLDATQKKNGFFYTHFYKSEIYDVLRYINGCLVKSYIEEKLFLKVNREKTKVAHISKVKYLGYSFYRYKGKCKLRVHPKSIAKMKAKLKELTSRSNGWSNEYRARKLTQFIRGWVNYFGLADMKSVLTQTDEWLRRKIREIYWKQWKKVKTRYRMIKKLGVPEWKVHELANCRKGTWRAAVMLNSVLTNKIIAGLGFISMTDYYLKICEN